MDNDVVAVHEAAHATMAVALGLTLDHVQLGDAPCYRFLHDPRPEQRLAEVMTLMAGCAGEEVILGREPRGGGSDDPAIARLLQGDAETEAARRRQVKLFIAGNVPPVRRIADALLRDGMLTGDEVERLVRGSPR